MNTHWQNELRDDLARLEAIDQLRKLCAIDPTTIEPTTSAQHDTTTGKWITRRNRRLLNFAGNDYLALAHHPKLKAAAIAAIDQFGVGSGASRLVTGHCAYHEKLEARFAAFKHAEAALLFSTGYMANLAVLTALPKKRDVILIDKLCHASLIDGARASDAEMRVFPHLNDDRLEALLERYRRASTKSDMRLFIVTDSIFSMDGDVADLQRLAQLAEQFNAVLIVDEAHATGLFGNTGAGLCEHQGVSDKVDIVISTASKAMAGLGGIVSGSHVMIDTLINRARSLIYTTAPPPAQVAAINAALDVIADEPDRRQHVLTLANTLRQQLVQSIDPKLVHLPRTQLNTPIIPLVTGDAQSALALSKTLENAGICAPAIRPPTVAPNAARVRLTIRADMDESNLDFVNAAIESWISR